MCFEKGFMIQYSEWTLTHASMSGAESSVAASLEGLCLPNSVQIQFSSVMTVSSVRKKLLWCLSWRTGPKPPLNGMSECAAITVSCKEEPFLFETLHVTIVFPANPLSSGHQTAEGQKSTMFLLVFFFYPPYHSSFRLCILKAVVFRGDQRTWHNAQFVAPSRIWYTMLSWWRQSQGIFLVCLYSDKHLFVISLENFKSGMALVVYCEINRKYFFIPGCKNWIFIL